MTNRKPLPPDTEAVKEQFGADARLYAEGRAETAKALGFADEAEKWDRVSEEIGPSQDQE